MKNYSVNLSDFFTKNEDTSRNKEEVAKIEKRHITNWEN